MRPIAFLSSPPTDEQGFKRWVHDALREIERASNEDVFDVADKFEITGTVTKAYDLNVGTATAADVAMVLATFILDMQQRGANRGG